ncbi:hypothetical protein AVM02_13095 [Brucella anthropi]
MIRIKCDMLWMLFPLGMIAVAKALDGDFPDGSALPFGDRFLIGPIALPSIPIKIRHHQMSGSNI